MADNFDVQSKITISAKEAQDSVNKLSESVKDLTDVFKSADSETKNLESSFDQATSSVNSFKRAADGLKNVGTTLKDIGKSAQEVGRSLSLYLTAPLVGFATLALKEFSNSEKEIAKLNTALASSGRYTSEASKSMQDFADALEQVSTFSAGAVIDSLALATAFTQSNEQAQDLVKASAELATFMGTDLNSAVRTLGRTMSGQAGQVGQLVKGVDQLTESQLKAGGAIRLVQQQLGGQALAASQTFGGQITILKNEFLALASVIGQDIAPYVQQLVTWLRELLAYFKSLDADTRRVIIVFGALAAAIGPLTIGFGLFASSVGSIITAFSKFVAFIPTLVSGFKALVAFIVGPGGLAIGLAGVALAITGLINVFRQLKAAGLDTGEALKLVWRLIAATFNDYVVVPINKYLGKLLSSVGGFAGKINESLGNALKGVGDFMQETASELDGSFDGVKEEIDAKLKAIGSSAASAFTLGFSDVVKDLSDSFNFDDFGKKAEQQFRNGTGGIRGETESLLDFIKSKTDEIKRTISGNLASGFLDFIEGTKSAGEAFRQFAQQTIRWLLQMIIQRQIYNAISGFFPSSTPSTGGGGGGTGLLGANTTFKYAQGGYVSGPGTGTSDSIHARLSNGEYVLRASAVKALGVGFLNKLNQVRKGPQVRSGGFIPAFANGGPVSFGGAPSIVIQNNGTEKTSTRTEYDPTTAVVTIVLDDLNKNGPMAKGIQQTFGFKRGGYK